MDQELRGPVTSDELTGSPALPSTNDIPTTNHEVRGSHKKRVCFDNMATAREHPTAELPPKRLRQNRSFMMQVQRCICVFVVPLTEWSSFVSFIGRLVKVAYVCREPHLLTH